MTRHYVVTICTQSSHLIVQDLECSTMNTSIFKSNVLDKGESGKLIRDELQIDHNYTNSLISVEYGCAFYQPCFS